MNAFVPVDGVRPPDLGQGGQAAGARLLEDDRPPPNLPPEPARPSLSSVVAPVELAERQERKRPAEGALLEESADVKRRNKRLFGAILGTLQRFSRNEEQARSTVAAQRRAELERRAEERKATEEARLRQEARDQQRQLREGDVARRREIALKAALVRLEILYATRLARADKAAAAGFFLTTTGPRLYWCPGPGGGGDGAGSHCAELDRLAEAQRAQHVAWKAVQMDQLEREKEELTARMTRRRDAPGGPGNRGSGGEDAAGGEDAPMLEHDDDEEEEGLEQEGRDEEQQGEKRGEQEQGEEPASHDGANAADAMDAAEVGAGQDGPASMAQGEQQQQEPEAGS